MRFDQKVVLITGGNRGIGLATAKAFSLEGARVVLCARNRQVGDSAARELANATFVACDVRRAEECERALERTLQDCGRLDVLVNGAGIIYRNRTVEQTSAGAAEEGFVPHSPLPLGLGGPSRAVVVLRSVVARAGPIRAESLEPV